MLVNRYASTVILNGYRVILVYHHLYICTIARHCLVDRVVHSLVDKMVQTFL